MDNTIKIYDYSVVGTGFHSSVLNHALERAKNKAKSQKCDVSITLNGKPYATVTKRLQLIAA